MPGLRAATARMAPALAALTLVARALQVLHHSYEFYEAQRSGALPPGSGPDWRGDSALADAAPGGASLAGGWYDAGGARPRLPAALPGVQACSAPLAGAVQPACPHPAAAMRHRPVADLLRAAAEPCVTGAPGGAGVRAAQPHGCLRAPLGTRCAMSAPQTTCHKTHVAPAPTLP